MAMNSPPGSAASTGSCPSLTLEGREAHLLPRGCLQSAINEHTKYATLMATTLVIMRKFEGRALTKSIATEPLSDT